MNAKTTKFLAMLAVLAVAFAGCVILLADQQDAANATEVTSATYPDGGVDILSIELETTAGSKAVVLYDSTVTIEGEYAYFFAEDATVSMPLDVTLETPVMFFVLNGVTVNVMTPVAKETEFDHGAIQFVNVKNYDADDGIITLNAAKTFQDYGYATAPITDVKDDCPGADLKVTYAANESAAFTADKRADKKFTVSSVENVSVCGDLALVGPVKKATIAPGDNATEVTVRLVNFTGTITTIDDSSVKMEVKDFNGTIKGTRDSITITAWTSGELQKSSQIGYGAEIELGAQGISFSKNVIIPGGVTFFFQRYVTDIYAVTFSADMTAGANGFQIVPGDNGLEITGTATLEEPVEPGPDAEILRIVATVNQATIYAPDAPFNPSILIVTAIYSDGSIVELDSAAYTCEPIEQLSDETSVTVTLVEDDSIYCTVAIAVVDGLQDANSITANNYKDTYYVGEDFNYNTLVVTATDGNYTWTLPSSDYTCSPTVFDEAADPATVTITAGALNDEFEVTVLDEPEPEPAAGVVWTFVGAAKVSGIINANGVEFGILGDTYQVTLENLRIDNASAGVTLGSDTVFEEQVTINGSLTSGASMIVAPEAYVNISGAYNFNDTKLFIGKDATFRASVAMNGRVEIPANSAAWADYAFIDSTGKFYLNQNQVTKASVAVVAYLNQIGAGTVSINSSICCVSSTYYIYTQVIPYLSLNPVDVVCTSTVADEAEISLDKVSYTGGELPIGNQARYNIDYSTGVPVFTVVFYELYEVAIEDAYDANVDERVVVTDATGAEVDMYQKASSTTTGYVKLAYRQDYTISGIVEENKYTFTFTFMEEETELEPISQIAASFNMVRGNATITFDEGLALTLTVTLDDDDENFAEGDVFMYYTTEEDGEPIPVVLTELEDGVGGVITVFNTDTIYFMSEFTKYYKFTASNPEVIDFGEDEPGVPATTVPFDSDEWTAGFTFGDDLTKTEASFDLTCELDEVIITFAFAGDDEVDPAKKNVTIKFDEYNTNKRTSGKVTVKASDDTTWAVTMYVGEIYYLEWSDITGKIGIMEYGKTEEYGEYYDAKTTVTVKNDLFYKLTYEDLVLLKIDNKTNKNITVTIGKYSADIAKNAKGSVTANDGKENPIALSIIGYEVDSWKFTYQYTDENTGTTKTMTVNAPSYITVYDFYEYLLGNPDVYPAIPAMEAEEDGSYLITITEIMSDQITYYADVRATEHVIIKDWDQNGYYMREMKLYVEPYEGFVVDKVEVKHDDGTESDWAEKKTIGGQEVWTYIMPATDVTLLPHEKQVIFNVSFVDQNDEPIGEVVEKVAGKPVELTVPYITGYIATAAVPDVEIADFVFVEATGAVTFTMLESDVVIKVTYAEDLPMSENVSVTIGQTGQAIDVVLFALDGRQIGSGTIDLRVSYKYIDEDGDIMTKSIIVPLSYVADGKTAAHIAETDFIETLGEYYGGVFAVDGTFTLGGITDDISRTAYTPVLEA